MCIKVLGTFSPPKYAGYCGDIIKVPWKEAIPAAKVKKGQDELTRSSSYPFHV